MESPELVLLWLQVVLDLNLSLASKSDEKCRPLLISSGARWIRTLGSAEGTGMHSRIRHCRNVGFVLKLQCMDEI